VQARLAEELARAHARHFGEGAAVRRLQRHLARGQQHDALDRPAFLVHGLAARGVGAPRASGVPGLGDGRQAGETRHQLARGGVGAGEGLVAVELEVDAHRIRDGETLALGGIPDAGHELVAHREALALRHAHDERVVHAEVRERDGGRERRRIGEHARRLARHGEQHLAHLVRRIVVAEAELQRLRALAHRPGIVGEGLAVERGVRDHAQDAARREHMHRAPVDLLHHARGAADLDLVADLERPLHQQHDPREQVAERLLQREAEHQAAETERGEGAGEVGVPDLRVDERGRAEHEGEPDEVAQQLRHPRLPTAGGRPLEEHRIGEAEPARHQRDPERGVREPRPKIVVRQAEHAIEQHHETDHRHDDVAQEGDGGRDRTAAPLQRGDGLVEHQQRERQTDQQPERGPPDLLQPRLQQAELAHARGPPAAASSSASGQSSTSPMPRTDARNEGPKATSSRTRSRTAPVTWMDVLPSDSMPRARRTVSPHRS
jgi:hypothetical protein